MSPRLLLAPNTESFRGNPAQTGTSEGQLPIRLSVKWKFTAKDAVKSTPVVKDSKVFVTSSDKNIYCLSLDKGEIIWTYTAGDSIEASALVIDKTVYVGSEDRILYAIDAEQGLPVWTCKTGGKITGSVNYRTVNSSTELFAGSYDGLLTCLDARTGTKKWSYEAQNYINGSPAIGSGLAIFGSCDATLYMVPLDAPTVPGLLTAALISPPAQPLPTARFIFEILMVSFSVWISKPVKICGPIKNPNRLFFPALLSMKTILWSAAGIKKCTVLKR
jgi:outer membrane protein assembly factor BamB